MFIKQRFKNTGSLFLHRKDLRPSRNRISSWNIKVLPPGEQIHEITSGYTTTARAEPVHRPAEPNQTDTPAPGYLHDISAAGEHVTSCSSWIAARSSGRFSVPRKFELLDIKMMLGEWKFVDVLESFRVKSEACWENEDRHTPPPTPASNDSFF